MQKVYEIQAIINWLTTYPRFAKMFDITKASKDGQLIDFKGTTEIDVNKFLRGKSVTTYVNDYILQVEKPFLTMLNRKDNSEFLTDFQKWVRANAYACPQLGNHGYQKVFVDAQEFLGSDENKESAMYQVMLHIEYKIFE